MRPPSAVRFLLDDRGMRSSAFAPAACLLLAAACAGPKSEPPAPAAAAPRPGSVAALPGENACQAAGRLGVSLDALRRANALEGSEREPLGARRLEVPAVPLEHRVLPGETLSRVASWYGHSVGQLARSNALDDPDRIAAGATLRIPPGARTACRPPANVASVKRAPAVSAPPPRKAVAPEAPTRAVRRPAPEVLARVDDRLDTATARYDAADFRAALALARSAGELVATEPDHPAVVERRARAAWLTGLAHAGLDEREEAVRALRDALALRPALRTDPRLSPRIAALLEETSTVETSAAASP
jgi:LysM repeat protein